MRYKALQNVPGYNVLRFDSGAVTCADDGIG